MTLWKDSKRANAQKLIDWLLGQRNSTGWPIDWVNTIAFAELAASSPQAGLTRSIVMQVLSEMNSNGKKSVDDFEEIFDQKAKENALASRNNTRLWRFFIPVEIALGSDIPRSPRICILGKQFSFLLHKSVERQVDRETRGYLRSPDTIAMLTSAKVEHVPATFLSVRSYGQSWYTAWQAIAPAFDALRGLFELSLDIGRWRIETPRGKHARGKIPPPTWLLAYEKGVGAEWLYFITDDKSDTDTFELTTAIFNSLKKKAQFLRGEPPPKSTLALASDCLRLYSQAMDDRLPNLCFLGFWQLAEAITNSESAGGKTDKVVTRLAWHGDKLGLKGSGYSETLLALGKKRNSVVHRGIGDVEDWDINILKLACEVALTWLIEVHKSLPTVGHVEQFYHLREINDAEFEATEDCVAYVRKLGLRKAKVGN